MTRKRERVLINLLTDGMAPEGTAEYLGIPVETAAGTRKQLDERL